MSEDSDLKALEDFVLNNPELRMLEAELDQFNIFEALGMVYQEIRHSNLLAFLLDPSQKHGLDDGFLKRLLMETLNAAENSPISLIEIDVTDLTGAIVQREWRRVDILIWDETARLVIAFENKMLTSEHNKQLFPYREIVQNEFGEYRHIFIYLTPDENTPSDADVIPLSYTTVADVLDKLRMARESTLGIDVVTLLKHYTTMLRRFIVSDSEIAELSRKIYRQHKQALDIIFEYRPDLQQDISDYIQTHLPINADGLNKDHSGKSRIRFAPQEWDRISLLKTGKSWTRSGRILLYEFVNHKESLSLKLIIGPGPEPVRQIILDTALKNKPIFKGLKSRTTLNKAWNTIFSQSILSTSDLENATINDLSDKIEEFWHSFYASDLPSISHIIENEIAWDELET